MNYLRYYREKAGFSQEDMAKRVGIHQTTYSHFEKNNGKINPEYLVSWAAMLGVTVDELLKGNRGNSHTPILNHK